MVAKVQREKRLSAAEKAALAVEVAKDTIVLLRSKRFEAKMGNGYLEKADNFLRLRRKTASLKNVIKEVPHCEVCAIGACFLGLVSRHNKVTVGEVLTHSKLWRVMSRKLRRAFSLRQLALIEWAFEVNHENLCNIGFGQDYLVSLGLMEPNADYYQSFRPSFVVGGGEHDWSEFNRAKNFGKSYPSDKARIMAILKNVITNGGEFKP